MRVMALFAPTPHMVTQHAAGSMIGVGVVSVWYVYLLGFQAFTAYTDLLEDKN